MRLLQALSCALLVFLCASAARAQNVSVAMVTRTVANQIDAFEFSISQEDCLSGDAFDFPVVLSNLNGVRSFEVWIGEGSADCSQLGARNNSSGVQQCRRLGEPNGQPEQFVTFRVASSEIAELGVGATGCVDANGSSPPRPVSIYFLLIRVDNVAGNIPAEDSFAWTETQVDLLGPVPPTDIEATPSDNAIELTFKVAANETDTRGFRFYCDDGSLAVNESTSAAAGAGGGSLVTTGEGGAGDGGAAMQTRGGVTAGAGGAGGAGDGGAGDGGSATSTSGATTTGTSDASATTADASSTATGSASFDCADTVLIAGDPPNPAWTACGEIDGTAVGEGVATRGVANGRTYAVAVAAIDDLDNEGVLSEVVCSKPFPVVDFYEAYVDAGGQAGGGLCGISLPGSTDRRGLAGAALAVMAAAVVIGRRSVRRRSARGARP